MGLFGHKSSSSNKTQKMVMKSQQKEAERQRKIEEGIKKRERQSRIEESKTKLAKSKAERRSSEREAMVERYKKGASYLYPLHGLKRDSKPVKRKSKTKKKSKLKW